MPTLMLISSLAELMEATLTLISSAADGHRADVHRQLLRRAGDAGRLLRRVLALREQLVRHAGEVVRRARPSPAETFWISVTIRLKASARVLVASRELADLVLLQERDALPQVAVGHRLGQVADLLDRPGDRARDEGGDDSADHETRERDPEDPGQARRVCRRAAVAAGRGLSGEELVEVGDSRHALIPRRLRLDQRHGRRSGCWSRPRESLAMLASRDLISARAARASTWPAGRRPTRGQAGLDLVLELRELLLLRGHLLLAGRFDVSAPGPGAFRAMRPGSRRATSDFARSAALGVGLALTPPIHFRTIAARMLICRWKSPFSSFFALTLVFWIASSNASLFTF